MIDIGFLLLVADAYGRASLLEDVTVSYRAFGDSKKLAALRAGADITIGRFNSALQWFSDNWPEKADWPDEVPRPSRRAEAAAPSPASVIEKGAAL